MANAGVERTGKADRAGGHRWSEVTEAAFLRHLRRGMTVKAAAQAAGFSAGNVYLLRRARPAFRKKWEAALAARRPQRAHGSILRYARDGLTTGAPARGKRVRCLTQWSEEVEEHLLDLLAATCNVQLSCAEAGVGPTSAYRQRRLRPDFAAKWQAALEQGYARIEMELVRRAAETLEGVAFDAERDVPPCTFDQAMTLLKLHRGAVEGKGRSSGWQRRRPPSLEEVRGSIERKVRAIVAAREVGEETP